MPLSDEQRMLLEAARSFIADRAPVSHLRSLRDRQDPLGFDRDLWRAFAEQGFNGVIIPEAHGGVGLGHVEAGIILEEIGRNLTPSPFLITAIGAAIAFGQASPGIQAEWLARIASGEAVAALALEEASRHRPERIACAARADGDAFVIDGAKRFVVQALGADVVIVVARTSGRAGDDDGLTLFVVDAGTAGMTLASQRLVDAGIAADISFGGVRVSRERVLGEVGKGRRLLDVMLAALRTGAAAELVGVGAKAFDMSVAYLKERRQFDRPIGSFQALQHRAAHLYAELEIARAAVLAAQQRLDAGDAHASEAAMIAKAVACSASALAVQEGVQMHGGIGMTDEFDIGLYMKRQRVLAELFGDSDYHADGFAHARGY